MRIVISMLINQKDMKLYLKDYAINSYCCNLKRKDHSGILALSVIKEILLINKSKGRTAKYMHTFISNEGGHHPKF